MSDDDDDFDGLEMDSVDKSAARKTAMHALQLMAKKLFARHADLNSLMLGVAQYWADEADDAVHYELCASARAMPLWPHRCDQTVWDDDGYENVPGEACSSCGEDFGYMGMWDDNGAAIGAFEAYCHEGGSQEESSASNYLPYAIARRAGDDVEIEIVGRLQRPENESDYEGADDPTWDDARARELLEMVAMAPADDGPRRVLADYLLERENPRGEYIALSLETSPTADIVRRRDELLAEHERAWLTSIADAVPMCSVRWRRGFPVAAEVLAGANDVKKVRGSVGWITLEQLHVHRSSECVLDPAMRALRELGPIDERWIDALADSALPWAIETLEIELDDADVTKLCKATTLPKLRTLTIHARDLDLAVASLPRAVWWKQLERLTVVDDDVPKWHGRHRELGVPWLAVVREFTDPAIAKGWEVAYGPGGACEITQRGWTPHASIDALATLLPSLPKASFELVKSAYYEPSPHDRTRLGL
jgi:uncharacterized protein (TIGR02996 family)